MRKRGGLELFAHPNFRERDESCGRRKLGRAFMIRDWQLQCGVAVFDKEKEETQP